LASFSRQKFCFFSMALRPLGWQRFAKADPHVQQDGKDFGGV